MFRCLVDFCLWAGVCLLVAIQVSGECANACNGHGKCTSYDMCICNRNWQAADCSERVCQFGLAHVDTPKGDLDGSGGVSNANELVIENNYVYPYGTTEQFPQMQNTDLDILSDTAHYYMECSNKGRCDRASGECHCFDGYDGVACQRASCPGYPNSCSGHGVCKSIAQLASADHDNVYRLWDKDATMGCECDAGYFGPDCSQRSCKYGVDPLYLDDAATIKYSIFDFATLTTKANVSSFSQLFSDGEVVRTPGYWTIRFFNTFGEDWLTGPIPAGATCDEVVAALEALPNNAVPPGTTKCTPTAFLNGTENTFTSGHAYFDKQHPTYRLTYKMAIWEAETNPDFGELSQQTALFGALYNSSSDVSTVKLSGYIYRLKFYGNPGALKQPEIELYLDGNRPTLISQGAKVITKVWTDGQQGEYHDYFADYCEGVTVTINQNNGVSFLSGLTPAEKNLLKKCLGNADFNTTNNVDVYNWDYGNKYYPHMIKLVRTVTTYNDGGYYAVVWFDANTNDWDNLDPALLTGTFKLLNPFMPPDALTTDNYNVYTTQGVLALTSLESELTVSFASNYFFTTNTTYDTWRRDSTAAGYYDGDLSCEIGANNGGKMAFLYHCLDKGDLFTYFNWEYPAQNPPHINLYSAERLSTLPYEYAVNARFIQRGVNPQTDLEMHYMTHMITSDLASNWGVSVGGVNPDNVGMNLGVAATGIPHYHVYKFFPAVASTYHYVAECANRGLCDRDSGICQCFPGYTSDSCELQSSLAV